jgi:hypothetical protein
MGAEVRVAKAERLAMRSPASYPLQPTAELGGHWFAIQDSQGRTLYERPLHNPFRRDAEVFGASPGDPLRRVEAEGTSELELLVPDLPDAAVLTLHGPSIDDPDIHHGRAREVASFEFDELRAAAEAAG